MKLISGRPVSSDPASQECFDVANGWLRECISSSRHQFCKSTTEELHGAHSPLPTRVIDVGHPNGSQEPRLILASNITSGSSRSYAALSHCWGGQPFAQIDGPESPNSVQTSVDENPNKATTSLRPLTTLKENIEDRMKIIPMSILPRTFRDAVKVTRGLGLRFLWIDSLCIIQDSKSDWEKEAAQMADIYKNSYVTIAAESSPDSHHGILNERHSGFCSIEVPFISKRHNIQTTMFIRPALDDWEISMSEPKSKLCSRAWVLQESLLAPRTIHYGIQQILWECRSHSLAEGDMTPIAPSTREKSWSWSRNKRFLSDVEEVSIPRSNTPTEGITVKDTYYLRWYSILNDYSSRKLTFPSDVFPALAGIATEFNRRLQDQYIAGLWKADLLRGLLWTVSKPELAKSAIPYRAPTWTWASIIGQITIPADDSLNLVGTNNAEILNVEMRPAQHTSVSTDGNFYSEISAGRLTLRGRWKSTQQWDMGEEEYWKDYIIRDVEEEEVESCYMFRYFDIGTEERLLERRQNRRSLSLVHVAARVGKIGNTPVLWFLILESGDDGDEAVYRRVGVVEVHNAVNGERWLKEWEMRTVVII